MAGVTILSQQFLYETAPFPSCHAATLVETRSGGIIAAFFGGTHERNPDVEIWICRLGADGRTWTGPEKVADGVQADGSRQPCWNPVLFQPREGPLMLFYKVGPSPSQWWGELKTSEDDGKTWSKATRLPDGILGPIKNKPVQLDGGESGGDILSGCSVEGKDIGWRVYFERSTDNGKTWTKTPYVEREDEVNAIQPSILFHSPTRLQALGRTQSKRMFECWSEDAGKTWGKLTLLDVPNPNSGTDAVTLKDGRQLLVYNHSDTNKIRYPLNVALSRDGKKWDPSVVLDSEPPGQYSYPAVIQARDGLVHVVYTWKRQKMRHAVLDVSR